MPNELTTVETNLFRRLEATIQEGMQKFLEVGAALAQIRDNRLYRAEYATWEDYLRHKWGRTSQWAHQLIEGSIATRELPPEISTMVDNPRVARAVARVPRERRAAVVREAARRGPVTARAIEVSAQTTRMTDCEGYPLPERVVPFFNRTREVIELQHHIAVVGRALKKAAEDNDLLFAEINTTGVVSDLRNISGHLNSAIPYAVCYQCQGHPETHCVVCKGRGFISKRLMATVPEELRKIREKGVKK